MPLHSTTRWLGLALVACGFAACSESPAARDDVFDPASDLTQSDLDAAGPDLSEPDSTTPTLADARDTSTSPDIDDADSSSQDVDLPPCVAACDQVLDCGIERCDDLDWRASSVVSRACLDACTEENVGGLAAVGCDAVIANATAVIPEFDSLCSQPLCETACPSFGACLVEQCVGYEDAAQLALECNGWCEPDTARAILSMECGELVDTIATGDPAFAATCNGDATCATTPECALWSDLILGCMRDNCGGHIDPWRDGLDELLVQFCTTDPNCPTSATLAPLLAPDATCETPGLSGAGTAPPFVELCDDTLGITASDARSACERLTTCGAEVGTPDACAASLAINPSATTLVPCVLDAPDCPTSFACFEAP